MAKIKEIKDDALINIQVNKSYYLMVKGLSLQLFANVTVEDKDAYLKDLLTKEYKDLDEIQRAFCTITLLLSEIEQSASNQNLFDEKEVLEPGDKGYKAPSLD